MQVRSQNGEDLFPQRATKTIGFFNTNAGFGEGKRCSKGAKKTSFSMGVLKRRFRFEKSAHREGRGFFK